MCPKSPALLGTSLLGKDEVHEFDSRHQLQMKTPLCEKRRGVFVCILRFFEGFVPGGAGPFFVSGKGPRYRIGGFCQLSCQPNANFTPVFSLYHQDFLSLGRVSYRVS